MISIIKQFAFFLIPVATLLSVYYQGHHGKSDCLTVSAELMDSIINVTTLDHQKPYEF